MPPTTSSAATTAFALSAAVASGTLISSVMRTDGRAGGNRTPNLRFWRPPLCQLSYCPVIEQPLCNHLGDHTGADGFAALADGEAQALFHRDRGDQLHHDLDVVSRHHHLGALRQLHGSGHIGGAEVELRPVALEEWRVPPALLLAQHIHFSLKLGVRGDRTGLAQYLPALHFLALRASEQYPDV